MKISAKTGEPFLRYFQFNIENGIFRGTPKISNLYFSANFAEIWFVVSSSGSNKKYILENFHLVRKISKTGENNLLINYQP